MKASQIARQVFADDENIDLIESTPLVFMHLMLFVVPFTGFSWPSLLVCVFTYALRVFALTAGFHRYFSHRSFKTSRVFQFILAFVGTSAAQLGPIWWAAHHRHHHEYSDTPKDIHSAFLRGFFWSHIGWLLCKKYAKAETGRVGDLLQYPELRFIDRFHVIAPLSLGTGLYFLGDWIGTRWPATGTTGWQMVAWAFFLSSVLVYHVTFMINSVTHMFGTKRFDTGDQSRNSLILALLTWGEGWHNNHHRYPMSARQGLYRREIDLTYYGLRILERLGLVWDIHVHPEKIFREAEEGRNKSEAA